MILIVIYDQMWTDKKKNHVTDYAMFFYISMIQQVL